MGWGLAFLFGGPLLILVSIGFLVSYFVTKQKVVLAVLAGLWIFVGLALCFISWLGNLQRPIILHKEDIIGGYRIDTNFCRGANARWQYHHFKFNIANDDSIRLVIINDKGEPIKTFSEKLLYVNDSPCIWHIHPQNNYHLLTTPTLYRKHTSFYYVFHSSKYGNMFFRKT
jgi:ABC-type transport system involved in multi-copper enzyme maturation permease subunit